MRVLIIIGQYPPDHGGAGKRIQATYTEIKNYALNHHENFAWNVLTYPCRLNTDEEPACNITYLKNKGRIGIFLQCLKIIIQFKPNIVHCVGLGKLNICAGWAALFLRTPYIFELSIDPPANMFQTLKSRLFNYPLKKASGYIALTSRIKSFFVSINYLVPVFQRPNPVRLPYRQFQTASAPPPYKHLILGRICERKNQQKAVQILSHLPEEHELIIAGPLLESEDKAYLFKLKNQISKFGLENRIDVYSDYINNVEKLIISCNSIWCFSKREGLPNVVLEGLWYGKPAFVNNRLGLQDIVINGKNGYNLDLDNPESIQHIISFFSEKVQSEEIQKEAHQNFNLKRHAEKTLSFIKTVTE